MFNPNARYWGQSERCYHCGKPVGKDNDSGETVEDDESSQIWPNGCIYPVCQECHDETQKENAE